MSSQKETIKKNTLQSRRATKASRYKQSGLTERKVKLSSKNFEKLMKQRGLSNEDIKNMKASTQKGTTMRVRHAKAGEKFVTTHGKDRSSGIYVSKASLGDTPQKRTNKGALPHTNTAEYETKVELSRNQNLVYGRIAPQSKFSKLDPKQAPRNGGGTQVITDGGYNSGAITNRDTKYPVPAQSDFQKRANAFKKQQATAGKSAPSTKKSKKQTKGQSM